MARANFILGANFILAPVPRYVQQYSRSNGSPSTESHRIVFILVSIMLGKRKGIIKLLHGRTHARANEPLWVAERSIC